MTATADAKRRALGKGLDSLLPRVQAKAAPANAEEEGGQPREIPLDQIDVSPFQTRLVIHEGQLHELADSIKANGVVQPVLVRPHPNTRGRYQLITGERRWRASKLAGKTTVPAFLRQVSDMQAMEINIVENLQRADLNPMEQARAYDRLSREFQMTQEQMAVRTGKDRTTVSNFLRLLRLPLPVQARVETGELTFGHARALLSLEHAEDIEKAVKKVTGLSLSVRQTESYVQGILHPEKAGKKVPKDVQIDPNVQDAQDRLQRILGLKVSIEDHKGKGKVIIEYARLEDFDTLLEQLGADK